MNNETTGLIIVNLGTPEKPEAPEVKKYLDEFLMDSRVIDYPYLFRLVLVKGLITPKRSKLSAAAYRTVWTDRGSPLTVITNDFGKILKDKVGMPLEIAMRYGNPTPVFAINQLLAMHPGINTLMVAPMYPHYAMSSYETALEYVKEAIKKAGKPFTVKALKPFYNEPGYIAALADKIKAQWDKGGYDALLFSYHGLPVRHLKKSDPTGKHCYGSADCCEVKSVAWDTCYKHQVKTTTRLVKERLNLPDNKVVITFQSRLGGGWIEPFTDIRLAEMPKEGIKKLLVVCPAFVADCLETLEEIKDRGRHTFMEAGGEVFDYVPCLNTDAEWVDTFVGWCREEELWVMSDGL